MREGGQPKQQGPKDPCSENSLPTQKLSYREAPVCGFECPRTSRALCSKKIGASIITRHYLKSLCFLHSMRVRAQSPENVGAQDSNTLF